MRNNSFDDSQEGLLGSLLVVDQSLLEVNNFDQGLPLASLTPADFELHHVESLPLLI